MVSLSSWSSHIYLFSIDLTVFLLALSVSLYQFIRLLASSCDRKVPKGNSDESG